MRGAHGLARLCRHSVARVARLPTPLRPAPQLPAPPSSCCTAPASRQPPGRKSARWHCCRGEACEQSRWICRATGAPTAWRCRKQVRAVAELRPSWTWKLPWGTLSDPLTCASSAVPDALPTLAGGARRVPARAAARAAPAAAGRPRHAFNVQHIRRGLPQVCRVHSELWFASSILQRPRRRCRRGPAPSR